MREGPVDVFLEMLRDEIVMALETVLGAALDQALEDALERRTWHCCDRPRVGGAERRSDEHCVNRTREEAAAQLRVHVSTIDRWRDGGRLPWHRQGDAVNGRVLIKQTDIDEFLLRGRRDAGDAAAPNS